MAGGLAANGGIGSEAGGAIGGMMRGAGFGGIDRTTSGARSGRALSNAAGGVEAEFWKNVLDEIKETIPREQFSTWFTGTELVEINNGAVTIGGPNIFKIKQIEAKYSTILENALRKNGVEVGELKYIISSTKPKARPAREMTMRSEMMEQMATVAQERVQNNRMAGNFQTGLREEYTMTNFVTGSNNEVAASVARSIIDDPGRNYNPFFLYGGSGLGKTHLVQAIGNEILVRHPQKKVLYLSTSSFYSEFINAVRNNKGDEFHQKFKKLDVLIIDDFQMIVGKERSQDEFFDIFNELHGLNKQIIVTSDRLPNQIKSVDERLASRLTWAGAFDLQLPQFEDKCAILKAKAEFKGVEIEDEAIEYLAENVRTNIRDLEGEFSRLLVVADLKKMTPLAVIQEGYVNATQGAHNKTLAPKQVVERVAKFYGLAVKEMCGKSRVAHIKNARQVAMYILSKDFGISTIKIAAEVGVKDHTTVMHGVRKIEKDLKLNFELRDQIAEIREKIYG